MTDLIACLSTGKGSWGHVGRLMEEGDWENIFLIGPQFSFEKFTHKKPFTKILFDEKNSIQNLALDIKNQLKGKVKNFQIALNLVSGSGREHMAIVSALLKLGYGIRLVALTQNGVEEV